MSTRDTVLADITTQGKLAHNATLRLVKSTLVSKPVGGVIFAGEIDTVL
jgi:hypothetical protein